MSSPALRRAQVAPCSTARAGLAAAVVRAQTEEEIPAEEVAHECADPGRMPPAVAERPAGRHWYRPFD
ncbi:hypothetical protein [Nonomuraea sp. NPDC050540]|uniref:hypothetical protein n=1 Tax=Nonomuraea sp. NPDC050540 TaxID=3364367 RepID=UPI0037A66887